MFHVKHSLLQYAATKNRRGGSSAIAQRACDGAGGMRRSAVAQGTMGPARRALAGSAGCDGAGAEGARRALGMRWGRHDGVYSVDVAIRWRAAAGCEDPAACDAERCDDVRGARGAWKGPCGIGTGSPALVIDVRMFHVKHSAAQHATPRIVGAQHATPRIIRARHGSAGRLQQRDTLRKGGARCSAA